MQEVETNGFPGGSGSVLHWIRHFAIWAGCTMVCCGVQQQEVTDHKDLIIQRKAGPQGGYKLLDARGALPNRRIQLTGRPVTILALGGGPTAIPDFEARIAPVHSAVDAERWAATVLIESRMRG